MNIADIVFAPKPLTIPEKILSYMCAHAGQPVSVQTLRSLYHPTEHSLSAALHSLKRRGYIIAVSRGYYMYERKRVQDE